MFKRNLFEITDEELGAGDEPDAPWAPDSVAFEPASERLSEAGRDDSAGVKARRGWIALAASGLLLGIASALNLIPGATGDQAQSPRPSGSDGQSRAGDAWESAPTNAPAPKRRRKQPNFIQRSYGHGRPDARRRSASERESPSPSALPRPSAVPPVDLPLPLPTPPIRPPQAGEFDPEVRYR